MVSVPCFCPFFLLGFRKMVFLLRFSSGLCAGEAQQGSLGSSSRARVLSPGWMRRYALRSLGREAAGLCSVCSSFYAAKPNRSERVSRLSAANDGAQRRSLALTQERAKIIVRALPGGRTAEVSCRPRDRLEEHDPARRTWRRDKDEPEEPNASAQSHAGRTTTRPPSERSDREGVGGALPTSSLGHDRPRRQARASAVPLLAQCLSRPWEPPSCIRMALQDEMALQD